MTLASGLRFDFDGLANEYGTIIRFRYFNRTLNAGSFDDDVVLAQSGTDLWTTGVLVPIVNKYPSLDGTKVEQGRVLQSDSVIYIRGIINTSGTFRVGVGSPAAREYSIIENGIIPWSIVNEVVYKELYVNVLQTGSLIGEG